VNWTNHLDIPPLRHVCVPKVHTASHLGELGEPLRHSTTKTHVCVPKLHTANHLFELS